MNKEQLKEQVIANINNYSKKVIIDALILIDSEEITTTEQIDEHFNG